MLEGLHLALNLGRKSPRSTALRSPTPLHKALAGINSDGSELTAINSTFSECHQQSRGNYHILGEQSVFSAHGSVFQNGIAVIGNSGFVFSEDARGSLADCAVAGHVVDAPSGAAGAILCETGSYVSVSRTTFRDNRAGANGGCFSVITLGTLTIDQSES